MVRLGAEWGCEMGQLVLSMGPVGAEACILVHRATTPSKRFLLLHYSFIAHVLKPRCTRCRIACVSNIVFSSAG
jgi:hypothetical protein